MIRVLLFCLAMTALPAPASAATIQDQIIGQLTEQGFGQITVSRTLLGRVRIVSFSDEYRREIVLNPTTGEILRDYWVAVGSGDAAAPVLINPGDDGGSGDHGGDDHGGDDNHDDDGHDDGGNDDGGNDD